MRATLTHFLHLLLLTGLLACSRTAATREAPLKRVSDSSGAITFSIPGAWQEEADVDGGRMFYADAPDAGTLRVSVITARFPKRIEEAGAVEFIGSLVAQEGRPVETLPDGKVLATFTEASLEDGQALHMRYWRLGSRVGPNHVRIAMFSYTLLKGQEREERFSKEVALIDAEIRKATWTTMPAPEQ